MICSDEGECRSFPLNSADLLHLLELKRIVGHAEGLRPSSQLARTSDGHGLVERFMAFVGIERTREGRFLFLFFSFRRRGMNELNSSVLHLSPSLFALFLHLRQFLLVTASSHLSRLRSLKTKLISACLSLSAPDLMLCFSQLVQEVSFQLLSLAFPLLVIGLLSREFLGELIGQGEHEDRLTGKGGIVLEDEHCRDESGEKETDFAEGLVTAFGGQITRVGWHHCSSRVFPTGHLSRTEESKGSSWDEAWLRGARDSIRKKRELLEHR